MLKRLTYFLFLLILLASCEEYYTPKIDNVSGQLVVDAMLTNDLSRNYVILTNTRGYFDEKESFPVLDAIVQLIDKNGVVLRGNEIATGSFIFKTVPQIGNSYKLRIKYRDNTYESDMVTMPPLPKILNASLVEKVKKEYFSDIYGVVTPISFPGNNICIDAPVTDSLSYYRFSTRSILEWTTTKHDPEIVGWNSYYPTNFNIAGPKTFSQASDKIEKHAIVWLANESTKYYLNTDTLASNGWILIVDQYGTSKGSFDYHEKLNSQFAADGSLFDPIPNQIHGNIRCLSDSSKIVYGYFDLNSYRQYRYFLRMYIKYNGANLRQLLTYPYIIDFGRSDEFECPIPPCPPPDWWEN